MSSSDEKLFYISALWRALKIIENYDSVFVFVWRFNFFSFFFSFDLRNWILFGRWFSDYTNISIMWYSWKKFQHKICVTQKRRSNQKCSLVINFNFIDFCFFQHIRFRCVLMMVSLHMSSQPFFCKVPFPHNWHLSSFMFKQSLHLFFTFFKKFFPSKFFPHSKQRKDI